MKQIFRKIQPSRTYSYFILGLCCKPVRQITEYLLQWYSYTFQSLINTNVNKSWIVPAHWGPPAAFGISPLRFCYRHSCRPNENSQLLSKTSEQSYATDSSLRLQCGSIEKFLVACCSPSARLKWTQPLTKMSDTCRIWLFVQGTLDTWHHLNLLLSHSPFLQSAQNLEKYITLSIDLASTTIAVRIQLYQQFKFIWDTPCIHPRLPALELMIVTWTHT